MAGDRVPVATNRCATCIFRPVEGGKLPLTSSCIAGLARNAEANDQAMVCHETYDDPVVCRGFYNLPRPPTRLQAAKRLGRIDFT